MSVLPRQGTVSYFGCCCSVFGLAASSARLAIHASYSGVPRRGGVSAGRPPIACGIKSPTCTLLQDGSDRTVRQRNADLIAFATRLISDLCRRIVALGGQRGPATEGSTQPVTTQITHSAGTNPATAAYRAYFKNRETAMKIAKIVLAGPAALTISSAALAQQALTGTVTKVDRINGIVAIQQTQSGTIGANTGGATE